MTTLRTVLAAVALAGGFFAAYRLAPRGPGVPAPGWFPDPSSDVVRQRWWDGRAWTGSLRDGGDAAPRGHRFRGRFWGTWALWLLGAVAVLVGGTALYRSSGEVHVIGATSLLGMAGVCCAFYGFVDRQLGLSTTVRGRHVVAVTVATSGATLVLAQPVNSWVIDTAGIRTATATVGLVEEGTKLLVPVLLLLLGSYRDPRAGIGIGLASGFGFAITEATLYAYQLPEAAGPSLCGGQGIPTDPSSVASAQVVRIVVAEPMHWLWTGIAVAVAWRLWHLHGRRGTAGAVTAFLAVAVAHSLNDSASSDLCDLPALDRFLGLERYGLLIASYLVFRAWARKSTPPTLVGRVTRAWTPRHLPTSPAADATDGAERPAGRP